MRDCVLSDHFRHLKSPKMSTSRRDSIFLNICVFILKGKFGINGKFFTHILTREWDIRWHPVNYNLLKYFKLSLHMINKSRLASITILLLYLSNLRGFLGSIFSAYSLKEVVIEPVTQYTIILSRSSSSLKFIKIPPSSLSIHLLFVHVENFSKI